MPDQDTTPRYCRGCLYDLRGMPTNSQGTSACPECGRGFDPNNPKTTLSRPMKTWRRVILRPPWVLTGLTVLLGLWMVWEARMPMSFAPALLFILFGMPMALAWGVRAIGYAIARIGVERDDLTQKRWRLICWLTPVTVGVAVTVLLGLDLPARMAVSWSREAMETRAIELLNQHRTATQPVSLGREWVGVLDVYTEVYDGGVYYTTGGFPDPNGLCYFPDPAAAARAATQNNAVVFITEDLGGGWYRFSGF